MSNTITAYFKGRVGVAEAVYQNDYGIVMQFDGIYLPAHFDCYFSKVNQEVATPGIGADHRVVIPNSVLADPGNMTIHIPMHTGSNDSEVEYVVYFKVVGRARPVDDGTPAQMTAIEQALALLQSPITNIEEIVNEALSFTGDTFQDMKADLQEDYNNFADAVNEDVADFKTEVRGDVDAVESDFTDLASDFLNLDAQFEAAVAAVTTDTEVTNIRVGDDNVTYTTAGEAVRMQIGNLNNEIVARNTGVYKLRLVSNKYILRDNGTEANYSGWSATSFIACPPNYKLVLDTNGENLIWGARYNENRTYVEAYGWSDSAYSNTTNEYVYFRISGTNAQMANVKAYLSIIDDITKGLDSRLKGRGITSLFTNKPVWFHEYYEVPYQVGSTYEYITGDTVELETGKDYILYCGEMDIPTDTGKLQLYITYTDSSTYRAEIVNDAKYKYFKLDSSKTIQSCVIYPTAVNGTATTTSGTAHFANMYIFEGDKLELRSIIDIPDSGSDINIPSYYKSHLSTQESAIRYHENNCSAKGDSLVFLTDTHHSDDYAINDNKESNYANACHSVDLIKHIMAHTGVRMIVFGGDLINSTIGNDTMIHGIHCYGAKFGEYKSRLVYCVGNHEYFTDLGQEEPDRPTAEWLYSSAKHLENEILGVGAKGSYYFDNVPQKIRYFVIPCGRDTEVDATQASWVMEEFEKVPDGYHIILIGHAFLVDMMNGFRGQYKYILEAFDAVKSKSQYFYNGVTYDYRGLDVTPVCAITGHTHIDGSLSTTGGIPCICTTCDSYRQNYEIQGGELVNVPRTKDTIDEQAFDVFQFDFTNRKIYCHRIGFGSDRQFTY